MPWDSSSVQTIEAEPSPAERTKKSRRRRQRCMTQSLSVEDPADCQHPHAIRSIGEMIEQIQRCEKILADGLVADGASDRSDTGGSQGQQLSERLLSKVKQLDYLHRSRCQGGSSVSQLGLDRNNNKCSNGASSSNAVPPPAAQLDNVGSQFESSDSVDLGAEETGGFVSPSGSGQTQAYPKHQDYCLCHKRKCMRCGCMCPCTEHACPSCGYTSRVVMTMRAVDGLKVIANAQKCRFRNGRMAKMSKCKPSKRKRFLLNDSDNECSHAVMVRVGGGFVPLVEYLKSHNKVVLSKFTRGDGSAFLSPWRPYYPGPLKKGRPRGIRYVDSVTQQLEDIIFANKEAGKSHCTCP